MSRRRRIVVSSAAFLLGVGALLLLATGVAARTEFGQERVRVFLSAWLSSKVQGSMYVGRVRGGYLDGVVVDSIEIRDPDGSLFLASGPVTVKYDLRDLFDRRLLLRHVAITNPTIHLRKYADGKWNFQRIFPHGQPHPIGTRRGFSDFILIDSALVENAHFTLTEPWQPPRDADRSTAARLLAEALAGEYGRVRQTQEGPVKVWRWENLHARFGHTRLAHPDTAGRLINVVDLAVKMRFPPFDFSGVRATVRQLGDSVWFDAPYWRLPSSDGRGRGKIVSGGGRPMRFAINVESERVALEDVAWVHPTFPRSGGGRITLDIRNSPRDESVIEFALSKMDVRTHGSHILGRMVVDPHDELVAFRDVSLRLAPITFDLLRVFNGEPFPYDWQGAFSGTLEASGGRVDRFRMERADLTYADAHVPGATSSVVATGVLDISEPALTVFHGVRLDVARLDLRTPRAVFPDFPRMNGHVAGVATLDSLWLDVRFRDADITHHDGDGPVSRFTGYGRITADEPYLTYDTELFAQQLSLTTLGRSYPGLPARGEFAGPMRITGQAPRLGITTALQGTAGSISFDGIVNADEPNFGAHGTGAFEGLDLRRFLWATRAPASALSGRYEVALSGTDAVTTAGSYSLALDRSTIGGARVASSIVRGRLAEGVAQLDTISFVSTAATVTGAGSVALIRDRVGSLRLAAEVASLPEVVSIVGADTSASTQPIAGSVSFTGELHTGPSPTLAGEIIGAGLIVGRQRARSVRGSVELTRVGDRLGGALSLVADTADVGSFRFTRAQIAARVPAEAGVEGTFEAALSRDEALTTFGGRLARFADTTVVRLDSLTARVDSAHAYRASEAATIVLADGAIAVDSLFLAPLNGGGSLAVRDLLWSRDSVRGSIRSRDADVGLLVGIVPGLISASGPLSVEVDVAGTRDNPRARGSLRMQNGVLGMTRARYERVTADISLDSTLLHIRELSAQTPRGGGRRGSANISGTVDLSDTRDPVFSIDATARSFRALSSRGVAILDISTGPVVSLAGPYSNSVLRGSFVVDEGTIYLPERLDKNITDLDDPELLALVDTLEAAQQRFLPSAPGAFVSNLGLDEVNIVIGEDVWLRSSEANIELGGSLRVTRTRAPDSDRAQLALVGTLNATRGTYVLNLAVVQPTFQVEHGTLRFFGTPEVNPALNIRAIHTVRQPRRALAREDVRILVAITGTLRTPELSLSSADNLQLSQSDLLSYLVTGEPSFGLTGTSTEYAEQLLTLGGRIAGNIISARIPRSVFDIVEVQPGAVRLESGTATGATSPYLNTLYNTRVILGKQLGDRWYMGLSTGFCRANFAENLGLRLEYRLSSTYFAQGGIEPGSGDLACVGPSTARTFQQTPPQLGLDLFRSWRF